MSKGNEQRLTTIKAIAAALLPHEDNESLDDPAWIAYSAIVWSERMNKFRDNDGRFPSPEKYVDDDSDPINPESAINQIKTNQLFSLAFDLGMELADRIAAEPLGDHNFTSILETYETRYLKHVQQRRTELFNKRQAADLVKGVKTTVQEPFTV